jgi:hypothetical protein
MRGLSAHGLPLVLVLALAIAQGLVPPIASAWTAATVRTARADVELLPDGRAHVAMTVRVRVDGGWLEGLEIEGLDRDAVLDPDHPLTFRDATGVALPVEVTAREGGRVSLRFARRAAPRRGEYEVDLAWSTALEETTALDADTLEARWIFPAWHYGLDGVEIRWIVPSGSTQQPADEITAPIEIEPSPLEDGRIAITHRRAHLPRTSDWETVVHVPREAWPHVVDRSSEDASPAALAPPSATLSPASSPALGPSASEDRCPLIEGTSFFGPARANWKVIKCWGMNLTKGLRWFPFFSVGRLPWAFYGCRWRNRFLGPAEQLLPKARPL